MTILNRIRRLLRTQTFLKRHLELRWNSLMISTSLWKLNLERLLVFLYCCNLYRSHSRLWEQMVSHLKRGHHQWFLKLCTRLRKWHQLEALPSSNLSPSGYATPRKNLPSDLSTSRFKQPYTLDLTVSHALPTPTPFPWSRISICLKKSSRSINQTGARAAW